MAYNKAGKIDRFGTMPEESFYHCLGTLGHSILVGRGKPETHYIDFSAGAPVLTIRPVWTGEFDTTEIAVREPATLAGLPTAEVTFEGPVKGRHAHEGGDLVVGWTVPGTYIVRVEAFPYLPAEFTLTVGASS